MRSAIREEVVSIEPFDALERTHCHDALAWIDSGAELCRLQKPAIPPKHLVSYFVLVDRDHVLLVDHKNAELWLWRGSWETGSYKSFNPIARESARPGLVAGQAAHMTVTSSLQSAFDTWTDGVESNAA